MIVINGSPCKIELRTSIDNFPSHFKLPSIRLLRYVLFVYFYKFDSTLQLKFDIKFCLFYSTLRDQQAIMYLKSPPDIGSK